MHLCVCVCTLFERILNRDPQKRPSALEILQDDYIAGHIRRMSTDRSELATLLAAPARPVSAMKRDAAAIRSSANTRVTIQELRVEERQKKLSNLDPRERRRVIKQEEADQRAAQLTRAARENFIKNNELKQRKQSDLRGSLTEQQREAEERLNERKSAFVRSTSNVQSNVFTKNRYPVERNFSESDFDRNGIAYEDGVFGPPGATRAARPSPNVRPIDDARSARARVDMSRTAPGNIAIDKRTAFAAQRRDQDDIPDEPLEAETRYALEDFESDSDDNDSTLKPSGPDDETVRDFGQMLDNLKKYAQINDTNGSRPSTSASRPSELVVETRSDLDAFGPLVRDTKVKNMRRQAIDKLTQAGFDKVYAYLKKVHDKHRRGQQTADKEVESELRRLVGPEQVSHCFLIDQLLFLESQN